MQSTEFLRIMDDELHSADANIRRMAIQRLHLIMFGTSAPDHEAAKIAVRGMAEQLAAALQE